MTEKRRLVVEERPYNAEVPLRELGRPAGEGAVFVRSHFDVPALRAETHVLQVSGAVRQSLELGLADLRRWRTRAVEVVLECAGNGRSLVEPMPPGTPWLLGAAGVARFEGVALADVLDDAGLRPDAVEILAAGSDRGRVGNGRTVSFERSLPLAAAMGQDVLLARTMNGRPLPPEHGFPLRLVVPGWYGVASVKWLVRLEALREPFAGWFQRDTYVYDGEDGVLDGTPVGPVRVRSLILSPEEGDTVAGGPVEVSGVAWSGTGCVASVALSADEGASWCEARLAPARARFAPCHWQTVWEPPGTGAFTLLARATCESGAVQPLRSKRNRLGYGNHGAHRVRVLVR